MKGVSPLISTVIVIAISAATITLVLTVIVPTINRAKEAAVVNEVGINMHTIDNAIKEIASEGVGSFRSIELKVSDGNYRIINYSGNYTGSVEYTLEAGYNTLPLLSIVKEGNIKYSTAVNTEGLIGYWRFEEDSGTRANDSSGYENYGNTSSANPTWTSGRFGSALSFNGSGTYENGDILRIPSLFSNSSICSMTMAAWSYDIGMDPAGSAGGVVQGTWWPDGTEYANIMYKDDNLRFELRNISSGNNQWFSGDYKNKWLFTTLVLDNGYVRAYVNGTQVWDGGYIGCINLTSWYIGSWDRGFNGTIDEVRVWKRALTANEIKAEYDPKQSDYQVVFQCDRIFIQGFDRFGRGSHKFCIEKTGTVLNRPLIRITKCG